MMSSQHDMVNNFIFDHLQSVKNLLENKDADIKELDLVSWLFVNVTLFIVPNAFAPPTLFGQVQCDQKINQNFAQFNGKVANNICIKA